jgi:hypothetical protein
VLWTADRTVLLKAELGYSEELVAWDFVFGDAGGIFEASVEVVVLETFVIERTRCLKDH